MSNRLTQLVAITPAAPGEERRDRRFSREARLYERPSRSVYRDASSGTDPGDRVWCIDASTMRHVQARRLKHVQLTRIDDAFVAALGRVDMSSVRSLDASRIGVNDHDVEMLAQHLTGMRWLSLAANADVTERGVRALCDAVARGLDLTWLDLRGTSYDATPYLDEVGDGLRARWRRPRESYTLERDYGLQRWMTFGRPPERENDELIPLDAYPPAQRAV